MRQVRPLQRKMDLTSVHWIELVKNEKRCLFVICHILWSELHTPSTNIRSMVAWVHLMYQVPHDQVLNHESQSHLPLKEKVTPKILFARIWAYCFFFYLQMSLRFAVQNLIVRDLVHEMRSGCRGSYFRWLSNFFINNIYWHKKFRGISFNYAIIRRIVNIWFLNRYGTLLIPSRS